MADRLVEAFAEYLHREIRVNEWGYAQNESLSNELLIREKYQGIRPAPGYPACPDHTEKQKIWDILDVNKNIGASLTETYAMHPASSVSGVYFANPKSKYFAVGQIGQDQLQSLAERKNLTVDEMRKWLRPNL